MSFALSNKSESIRFPSDVTTSSSVGRNGMKGVQTSRSESHLRPTDRYRKGEFLIPHRYRRQCSSCRHARIVRPKKLGELLSSPLRLFSLPCRSSNSELKERRFRRRRTECFRSTCVDGENSSAEIMLRLDQNEVHYFGQRFGCRQTSYTTAHDDHRNIIHRSNVW